MENAEQKVKKEKCDKCHHEMEEEEWCDVTLISGRSLLVCGSCCEQFPQDDIQHCYK